MCYCLKLKVHSCTQYGLIKSNAHSFSFVSSPIPQITFPHHTLNLYVFFKLIQPLSSVCIYIDSWPSTGAQIDFQGLNPCKNLTLSPQTAIKCQWVYQLLVGLESLPQLGYTLANRVLADLVLWNSCACSHGCYEFIYAKVMSYLANNVLSSFAHYFWSYDLCVHFPP